MSGLPKLFYESNLWVSNFKSSKLFKRAVLCTLNGKKGRGSVCGKDERVRHARVSVCHAGYTLVRKGHLILLLYLNIEKPILILKLIQVWGIWQIAKITHNLRRIFVRWRLQKQVLLRHSLNMKLYLKLWYFKILIFILDQRQNSSFSLQRT